MNDMNGVYNNVMSGVYNNVMSGVFYNNIERSNELNERIAERNIPSAYLEPQFSLRPVSTKYATLPMIDRRMNSQVNIKPTEPFNIGKVFNPGSAQAPWSGYATNIDVETILRNQTFALQKDGQSTYVPSSNSDLYQVQASGRYEEQPFPNLFEEPSLAPFNTNPHNIGLDVFNNSTRQQLKNIDPKV